MRKTRESMSGTVLETYTRKILTTGSGVKAYGGDSPKWFQYDNGSRIYIGGIDKPSRALSAERDFIYVNQAEELTEDEWETLLTRCTGRAGNMPFGMLFGDCNPAGANHWIKLRARDRTLRLLESTHEDNPRLFNLDTGEITEAGKRTLKVLDSLTGARKERLRFGKWVSPEGLVYSEFTDANIVGLVSDEIDTRKVSERPADVIDFDPDLPIELAMDDGYIDPRVTLFIQKQRDRILVFAEMYHRRHLAQTCVSEIVDRCKQLYGTEEIEDEKTKEKIKIAKRLPDLAVIPPESIELRERLRLANMRGRWEVSRIAQGIEIVRRLFEDDNGHRAIVVHRRCVDLLREITEGYKYPPETQSTARRTSATARSTEDLPIDADNHGPDALRYWVWMRARRLA